MKDRDVRVRFRALKMTVLALLIPLSAVQAQPTPNLTSEDRAERWRTQWRSTPQAPFDMTGMWLGYIRVAQFCPDAADFTPAPIHLRRLALLASRIDELPTLNFPRRTESVATSVERRIIEVDEEARCNALRGVLPLLPAFLDTVRSEWP